LAAAGVAGLCRPSWPTLAHAGWGLLLVASFQYLPLVLDADPRFACFSSRDRAEVRTAIRCWRGGWESPPTVSMPAGQIGGPVFDGPPFGPSAACASEDGRRPRSLSVRLCRTFAQIAFALMGVILLGAQTGHFSPRGAAHVRADCQRLSGGAGGWVFILIQRRGLV